MRFIMFPGIAADARMFEPQLRAFPFLETPGWLEPERFESLERYCERLADSLDLDGEPLVIGGVSFGGMVAQVLAERLNAEATLLIATWRPGEPQTFGVPCLRWIMHRKFFLKRFEPMDDATRELLLQMLEEADWDFIRWAFGVMARFELPKAAPNVWRLHGLEDKVLLPPPEDEQCRLVEGAGQALSAVEAEKTNAFIGECLQSLSPGNENLEQGERYDETT
ncbi:MAG: alpha/beta hydrolase [Candidatus Sumerlaeota bacterium]